MTATTRSRFEQAAVDLANRGYHVFPCKPRTKKPLTTNGFKEATRDERKILQWWERWPDANVGVACGASGITALDIDAKAGADPREVTGQLGLGDYPRVLTGEAPSGALEGERGAHIIFADRYRTVPQTTIAGVELRGDGAYIVAPPSVHPSGVAYEGDLPPVDRLPPMPEKVRAILQPSRNGKAPKPDDGEPIGEGQRNSTLASHAGRMRRIGMTTAEITVALLARNRDRCRPPLEDSEVRRIAASIGRYPAGVDLDPIAAAGRVEPVEPEEAKKLREDLARLLGLRDMTVLGTELHGTGPSGVIVLNLSNGRDLEFEPASAMAKPQTLLAALAVQANVTPTLAQPECMRALAAASRLAEVRVEVSEVGTAEDWGASYLQAATVLDVDTTDQRQRWGAWAAIKAHSPYAKASESGTDLAGAGLVIRDRDGSQLVRAGWFQQFVKSMVPGVSHKRLPVLMSRAGWEKPKQIKATAPDLPQTLKWEFYRVPADWEGPA